MNKVQKYVTVDVIKEHTDGSYDVVISTEGEDRDGDIIEVDGWETADYMRNPVILFAHNYRDVPIGQTQHLRKEAGRLVATFRFRDPANEHDPILPIKAAWDQGILRAASVGFRPISREPVDDDADGGLFGPFRYTRQELLEWSIVPIPANQEALRLGYEAYIKGLGRGMAVLSTDDYPADASEPNDSTDSASDELSEDVLDALARLIKDVTTFYKGDNNHV